MKYKQIKFLLILAFAASTASAQKSKSFTVTSPDGKIAATVDAAAKLNWSVRQNNTLVIAPSAISMTLDNGEVLGDNAKVISSKIISVNTVFNTAVYKKKSVVDNYNQLTINCKGDYSIIIRAYNDGVAYRFFYIQERNAHHCIGAG